MRWDVQREPETCGDALVGRDFAQHVRLELPLHPRRVLGCTRALRYDAKFSISSDLVSLAQNSQL
jgi:hypothetical protein